MQRGFCRFTAALLFACWHGAAAWALPAASADCDAAGHAAEQRFGLPPGLLHAVGVAESGRWDAVQGHTAPWPWAVDLAGRGKLFDSEAEASRAVGAELAAGRRNVDVGCFQINLQYHPLAFTDLAQAFDARANADYAARFLSDLHAQLGTWEAAVAAYHSANAVLGEPYQRRVFAVWSGVKASDEANSTGFNSTGFKTIAGVRVWTPVPPGDAPLTIVLQPVTQNLPRITTPRG